MTSLGDSSLSVGSTLGFLLLTGSCLIAAALRLGACSAGELSDKTSPMGRMGVGVASLNGLGGASVRTGVLGALIRPDDDTTIKTRCYGKQFDYIKHCMVQLDHIDVIITYDAICLTTTVANSVEFAAFETPSLPKMHQ